MPNEQPNALEKFDARAKARLKAAGDWRKTPIIETSAARATDPLSPANLWGRSQPSLNLREISHGLLRDGTAEENRAFYPRGHEGTSANEVAERQRDREKAEAEEAHDETEEKFAEYLPEPSDDLHIWVSELGKHLDINIPERQQLFAALQTYIARFPVGTTMQQLRGAEPDALTALVKVLCAAGEEESERSAA